MSAYDILWDEAEENFGLVSAAVARKLGISKQCLTALAQRGMLRRMGHGIYQVKHHIPGPYDTYAIGLAIVGEGAYLRSASVIALLDLAPTDPSLLYVGSPLRVRRQLPYGLRLRDRCACETENFHAICCQRLFVALREARAEGALEADQIVLAAQTAKAKGLITNDECTEFKS